MATPISNRKVADIDGLAVPMIALPDLIIAKRTSGREQDLRDVAGLERIAREENGPCKGG